MNEQILHCLRRLRKAEIIWRLGRYLQVPLVSYYELITEYTDVAVTAVSSLVADCCNDQRKLYRLVDSWLGRGKERCLLTHRDAEELAKNLNCFLSNEVGPIKPSIVGERNNIDPATSSLLTILKLQG